jgi:hypothetical protein
MRKTENNVKNARGDIVEFNADHARCARACTLQRSAWEILQPRQDRICFSADALQPRQTMIMLFPDSIRVAQFSSGHHPLCAI